MKKITRFTAALFSLILLLSASAEPERKTKKIIFLYCTMIDGTITLRKMEIVDGTLKTKRRNQSGDIIYEITNIQNAVLEQGSMRSPDIVFHDYIDPVSHELKSTLSRTDTITFVVRLPYNSDYHYASFYDATAENVSLGKRTTKLIGSFPFPAGFGK